MYGRRCPGCGLHETELAGSTNVGCDRCYTVFFDLLSPLIWSYQGSTVHHGKSPPPKPEREKDRRAAYREAIERARQEGRGDDADILTDLLDLLEGEAPP